MPRKELTERQKQFAKNFADKNSATFGNATKSYISAGYKQGTATASIACQLLHSPNITKYLSVIKQELQEKEQEKTIQEQLSESYTLQHIKDHLERCISAKDNTNTTAVLKILAQYKGLLIDKKEVSQHNSYTVPTRHSDRVKWLQEQQELLEASRNAGTGLPVNIVNAVLTQGKQAIAEEADGQ